MLSDVRYMWRRFRQRFWPVPLDMPMPPTANFFSIPDDITIGQRYTDPEYLAQEMPIDWPVIVAMEIFCCRVCLGNYALEPDESGIRPLMRDPEGKTYAHAMWMLWEIADKRIEGRKAHRWLGYAQAILIGQSAMTLDDAKQLNREASELIAACKEALPK